MRELAELVAADRATYRRQCVREAHALMNVTSSDRDLGLSRRSCGVNIVVESKLANAVSLGHERSLAKCVPSGNARMRFGATSSLPELEGLLKRRTESSSRSFALKCLGSLAHL